MKDVTKTTEKTTEFVVSPADRGLGICATCNHAPTCVNLKVSKQPIWHCDQFDDYISPSKKTAKVEAKPAAEVQTNGHHEGLCSNCAHRATCPNHVPGVAIWHCEEFA